MKTQYSPTLTTSTPELADFPFEQGPFQTRLEAICGTGDNLKTPFEELPKIDQAFVAVGTLLNSVRNGGFICWLDHNRDGQYSGALEDALALLYLCFESRTTAIVRGMLQRLNDWIQPELAEPALAKLEREWDAIDEAFEVEVLDAWALTFYELNTQPNLDPLTKIKTWFAQKWEETERLKAGERFDVRAALVELNLLLKKHDRKAEAARRLEVPTNG